MNTKIRTGTIENLKDLVANSMGKNISAEDVAVVHAEPELSGKFNISKSNIIEFLTQVEPMLKNNEIAVVTAEDMNKSPKQQPNKIKPR